MEITNLKEVLHTDVENFIKEFEERLMSVDMISGDLAIYSDNPYILYDSIINSINKYNNINNTKIAFILAKKNSLCDFSKDPRNIIGKAKPVCFYTIKSEEIKEISIEKLNKLEYVVFFEDANLYPKILLHNIVKFGIGNEIIRLIHLRININIPDASANNTVSHIVIE